MKQGEAERERRVKAALKLLAPPRHQWDECRDNIELGLDILIDYRSF
jgi:hypothetical protein